MAARFFPSHQWLTYLGDHLGHMIQNWMQLWTIDNYKDSDTGNFGYYLSHRMHYFHSQSQNLRNMAN